MTYMTTKSVLFIEKNKFKEMELDAQWNPLQEQVEKQNLHKQKDLLVLRFQNLHSDFVFDRRQ